MMDINKASGKYTIGCRVLEKHGRVTDGVYTIGDLGFTWISKPEEIDFKEKHIREIYVIDNIDDVQKYIQFLSRIYRNEFRSRAKKLNVDVSEFRFYPIKLTNSMFENCDLKLSRNHKIGKQEMELFKGNSNNIYIYELVQKNKQGQ